MDDDNIYRWNQIKNPQNLDLIRRANIYLSRWNKAPRGKWGDKDYCMGRYLYPDRFSDAILWARHYEGLWKKYGSNPNVLTKHRTEFYTPEILRVANRYCERAGIEGINILRDALAVIQGWRKYGVDFPKENRFIRINGRLRPTNMQIFGKTDGGIAPFMSVKIRKIFEKLQMPEGYPLRPYQYIGYYASLGIYLPDYWEVHGQNTMDYWASADIYKNWHYYRSVNIWFRGGEWESTIRNLIPTTLDAGFTDLYSVFNQKWISIIENLGFYNTINDFLIKRNWDLIYIALINEGY